MWARQGNELFFVDSDRNLISVQVGADPAPHVERRQALFTAPLEGVPLDFVSNFNIAYDVSPDGQRFLFGRDVATPDVVDAPRAILVKNWFRELNEKVPE
jgi:hypothetical protein